MITPAYVRTMARYNTWQNGGVYDAATQLSDDQRKEDRGAFFRSIHATLNHLLWADQTWLSRFGAADAPRASSISDGLTQFENWDTLDKERRRIDALMEAWAEKLEPSALSGELTWFSGAAGRNMTRPRTLVVTHIFNHQTHHRGQVSALLTGFNSRLASSDLYMGSNLYVE